MQQEEIEHVEEVEHQSGHIQSTVCLDEATIIEQDEEEIEEEIEEEEEEVEEMFTLELAEDPECEDKEYLGMYSLFHQSLKQLEHIDVILFNFYWIQLNL